ncbi:MAG: caspase family protein [Myxococcales bacterium]|nr:caspase family protein [Myxococcales bacterium]
MKFRLIVCGTNTTKSSPKLNFAESDAARILDHFTGALGPLSATSDAQMLLGASATRQNILNSLTRLGRETPDYLVFYFSGHGGTESIEAVDASLHYMHLANAISAARASRTLIILDVCHAGAFRRFFKEARVNPSGFIKPDWLIALSKANPGTRIMMAATEDQNAKESAAKEGGHFTSAILAALGACEGDIIIGNKRWISDHRAFAQAWNAVRTESGGEQEPVGIGLDGYLPLALSQAGSAVGSAVITSINHSGTELIFETSLGERSKIETHATAVLMRPSQILHQEKLSVRPLGNREVCRGVVRVDPDALVEKLGFSLSWFYYKQVELCWHLILTDDHHHELDVALLPVTLRQS